jgi:hypothetical protein
MQSGRQVFSLASGLRGKTPRVSRAHQGAYDVFDKPAAFFLHDVDLELYGRWLRFSLNVLAAARDSGIHEVGLARTLDRLCRATGGPSVRDARHIAPGWNLFTVPCKIPAR